MGPLQEPPRDQARRPARRLAGEPDNRPSGKAQFEARDAAQRFGAPALEAALGGRKRASVSGVKGDFR
jgi:hypothetical protein